MQCQGPAEARTWAPGLPCSSSTGCHVDAVLVLVLALSTTGCGFCVPLTFPSARDSGLPKAVVTSRTHPSVGPRAPVTAVFWGQRVCAACLCWWEVFQMRELDMGVSTGGQGGRRTVNHSSLAPEPGSTPMSHRAQCHRPAQDGRQVEVTLRAWLRPCIA